MQEDRVSYTVKTYKRVWKIEKTFYSFERWKLPRPVTVQQMLYFIIAVLVVVFIHFRAPILLAWIPWFVVKFIGVPGLIAFYLSKIKHDGLAPHKWLYVQINYWLSPKYLAKFSQIEKPGRLKYSGITRFREHYQVTENTKQKKRRFFIGQA